MPGEEVDKPKVLRSRGLAPLIGAFTAGHRAMDAQARKDLFKFASAACGAAGFLLITLFVLRGWGHNNDVMLSQLKDQYAQDRLDRRQQHYEDRMDRARDACITSRAVDTANAMVFHIKPKTPDECWSNWKPPAPPSIPGEKQ